MMEDATRDDTNNSDKACYVCFDADASTVLLACGHQGLCAACAARLWRIDRRCPLCRRRVNGVVFLTGYFDEDDGDGGAGAGNEDGGGEGNEGRA